MSHQSWGLHVCVPGMFKGMPQPPLSRRASLLSDAFLNDLKLSNRHARKRHQETLFNPLLPMTGSQKIQQPTDAPVLLPPDLLLQLLVLDAEKVAVSISPVLKCAAGGTWPSLFPAGLAPVPSLPLSPNSAYRKLVEALHCMGLRPQSQRHSVVELGACPGGWTSVFLTLGCTVTAVDRAELAPHLMKDKRVRFVKGDAFSYLPKAPVDIMASDVAAFPPRVVELIEKWCGSKLAKHLIVQMKFTGECDWTSLDAALATARRLGYHARAKRFFNDKNEQTIMLSRAQ